MLLLTPKRTPAPSSPDHLDVVKQPSWTFNVFSEDSIARLGPKSKFGSHHLCFASVHSKESKIRGKFGEVHQLGHCRAEPLPRRRWGACIQMNHFKIILFAAFHWKKSITTPNCHVILRCQTSKKFSFSVRTENRGNPQIGATVYGRSLKEWLDDAGYSHHRSLAFSKGKLLGSKTWRIWLLKNGSKQGGNSHLFVSVFSSYPEFGQFNRRKVFYRLLGCNNELLLRCVFLSTIPPLENASWHNGGFVACKP